MGPLSAPGTHRPIGNGGGGGDGWLEVVMPRDASMNPSTLKTWDEPVVRCNTYAPPSSVDPYGGRPPLWPVWCV